MTRIMSNHEGKNDRNVADENKSLPVPSICDLQHLRRQQKKSGRVQACEHHILFFQTLPEGIQIFKDGRGLRLETGLDCFTLKMGSNQKIRWDWDID